MTFRFPLQTVLHLRQIAEEREERMVEEILRDVAQQQQELEKLARDRERLGEQNEAALRAKTSAAELVFLKAQMQDIREQEIKGRRQLVRLEEQRRAQMKVYENAHRNRELLSRMREGQMEHFKRAQARKEQMQMDDMFSCRRAPAKVVEDRPQK